MQEYFQEIGERLAERWKPGEPLESFTAAAFDLLETSPPESIDAESMTRWAIHQDPFPEQVNFGAAFGEPALTVFSGDGFYIEALYWFTSRTSIHGHGFGGAFRVLSGHSLQTEYSFSREREVCPGLELGELSLENVRLISPEDICAIDPGETFVHSVAHFGRPSITLVARTSGHLVDQSDYARVGLAWQSYRQRKATGRKLDVIEALKRSGRGHPEKAMLELVKGDARLAMMALLRGSWDADFENDIAQAGAAGDLDVVSRLIAAVGEIRRSQRIWGGIESFPEPQRLGIALAELFDNREAANEVVGRYFPGSSVKDTLAKWNEVMEL